MLKSTLSRVFLRRGFAAAAAPPSASAASSTIKHKLNKKQFAQLRRVFEELTADHKIDASANLDVAMFKRICAKVIICTVF